MIPLEQLRESSIYQLILEEGKTEGLKQGLEQGLERGLEQGLERGLEQGLERGLEQGLERGLEHEREILVRQLRRKFGILTDTLAVRVWALPREAIERLAEDLFDMSAETDLAAWLDRIE